MNEVLKIIDGRRSVRAYSKHPITPEEKNLIFSATLRAPTAGNMMLYSIIEIQDQNIKDRLAVTCDHQPFIAKAPLVLLFLADYQKWVDYFNRCGVEQNCRDNETQYRTPHEGDLLLALCDALIAAQTAVIAAESLGIGSCYIGDILEQYEIHRDLFELPQYAIPITLICFGHPATNTDTKRSTRFETDSIIHIDKYRRFIGKELDSVFMETEKRFAKQIHPAEIGNAGQMYYYKKFAAGFAIEMSRSVKEMLKNWIY